MYDVALTVTNSEGMDATATQSVDATGNAAPAASMTSSVKKKKVTFDAARSSDLDGKVAKWWLPDGVVFIEEVPKTSVGKFSKKSLRERFPANPVGQGDGSVTVVG